MVSITEKLGNITDEVDELHPLLERLFRRIGDITDLEYTHGTREMGADFVLVKSDPVLASVDYVGVIAKLEGIRQDHAGIDRQIEECKLPRLFRAKEEIRLSEIWVITVGTISKNAQEKLTFKYASSNVKFIGRDRLTTMIAKYLPEYESEVEIDVGDYLTSIRTRNEEVEQKYSLLPFQDGTFYIEQDIYAVGDEPYKANPRRRKRRKPINIHDEIRKHTLIMIEGGMGSGKSKLLRHLVAHYSDPNVFLAENLIPIPVSFKDLVDGFGGDVHAFIDSRGDLGLPPTAGIESTILILVDAVDEKDIPLEEQVALFDLVRTSISKSPRKIKVVLTSRYLRGVDSAHPLARDIARYDIRPLSLRRVVEFLTRLCSRLNLSTRLIEDLRKSQLFRELPRSPIAAIILAQLLRENTQDLPANLTELYSKYVELILGRWDLEKGLQSQKEYEALDNILMRIAEYMVGNEISALAIGETREMFDSYLRERNLNLSVDALFQKLEARSELVVIDKVDKTFSFKHRTFAEFLLAKRMTKKGSIKIDERAYEVYWMNTFFFSVGLTKDAPELLTALIELQPTSEGARWMKVMNLPNYLLAAYTTPYSSIEDGVYRAAVEAAELYLDVAEGRSNSPLGALTRMHLLFLIQYLVRNGYSYEFLGPAIEAAGLRIATEPGLETVRPYALFFLNVAYIELGEGEGFDFMLKELPSALPTDVSLAIHHEAQDFKDRSKLLRKHEKRVLTLLRSRLKGGSAFDAGIRDLYERPVRLLLKPSE